MQGEGVSTDAIRDLDVSDMSGHWARAQAFIGIADEFTGLHEGAMDAQARQRQVVLNLIEEWQQNPPLHPVILAGSTGSRGTTLMLMQAIARCRRALWCCLVSISISRITSGAVWMTQ